MSVKVTLDEGSHVISIWAANEAGNGPERRFNTFVGTDAPAAVTDIQYTLDNNVAELKWTAPDKSVYGGPFDESALRYTVVRYPDETVVASNIAECEYTETVPTRRAHYYYSITPSIGKAEGPSAESEALTVQSYTGKSVNYTIEVIDGETGEVYQEAALKATKTLTDIILAGDEAHAVTYIKISTQNERLFVDRIRVLTGTYTEDDDAWTIGATDRCIDGISDTTVVVDGLEPERTYTLTVKAVADEALMDSPESQPVTVVTPPIASVCDITHSDATVIGMYDIYGRVATHATQGLLIIKYSDGSTVKTIR